MCIRLNMYFLLGKCIISISYIFRQVLWRIEAALRVMTLPPVRLGARGKDGIEIINMYPHDE
jgi:hypothetical protein